jgi:hypothetical protein
MISDSEVDTDNSTRDPLTYSFVPNLVWLPRQVGKLSDREGSFSQTYLQALSVKIYRSLPVAKSLRPFVDKAWAKLDVPEGIPDQGLPDINELNFFKPSTAYFRDRRKKIKIVSEAFTRISRGERPTGDVISKRYTLGINSIRRSTAKRMAVELDSYYKASLAAARAKAISK